MPVEIEEIDLCVWFEQQSGQWSLPSRPDDLQIKTCCNPIRVATNPLLLGQLIANLVDNAWKYSQRGDKVIVGLNLDGDFAVVDVRDHGIGLSHDDLSHIFQPFFRSQRVRKLGLAGTGLGLAVVQRIARILDIQVTAVGDVGEESLFRVLIPIRLLDAIH